MVTGERSFKQFGDNIDRYYLTWTSNLPRDQRKQYVLQLYHEGKTIREISELVHMSFRDIGAIINRYKDKIDRENGLVGVNEKDDIKSKSKTTQAIKMFSEGQTPTQVVIELDLPPEEVREMHRQYLEKKLQFEQEHGNSNERNFLMCKSCFWCASFLNNRYTSFNEKYTFDYDPLQGVSPRR